MSIILSFVILISITVVPDFSNYLSLFRLVKKEKSAFNDVDKMCF